MPSVIFYEKTGCATNTKQKKLLSESGFEVIAKNLLTESWQAETLQLFFAGLNVSDWFNLNAPAIKYGEIDIDTIDETQALALMIANPILIRRPLIQINNDYFAGFDLQKLSQYLTIKSSEPINETCSHTKEHRCREHSHTA